VVRKEGIIVVLLGLLVAPAGFTQGAPPLPYQAGGKHLGVATCSSSVCHGAVAPSTKYDISLNEYVTWSHEDSHSKAYLSLTNEKGRAIAAKLGIADPRSDKLCLDCHTDNVPAARRGPKFTFQDGVSCEACHGGAESWLESHASRKVSYRQNVERGMYPTADLAARATLCLSCHYGNEDKFATHRIMGAGHPRLSFELDTFVALQPAHHQVDDDYRKRKPAHDHAQIWAYGQLAALRSQLAMLQSPMAMGSPVFPELAMFSCHSCHGNPIAKLDWSRGLFTKFTQPGAIPLDDAHLKMAWAVLSQTDRTAAQNLLTLGQELQEAAGEGRDRIASTSMQLMRVVGQALEETQGRRWAREDYARMLGELLRMGASGEFRDYASAEQAVMAVELLMIDIGSAERFRKLLDELYEILRDEDGYRPARLADAMKRLAASLRS
jgi:hypothetical protein